MKRGPKFDARPVGSSFLEKAAAAWSPLPEWVAELARLADREGLAGAERRIGYSRSAISTVIGGKYAGDVERVAQMVRGALLAETVSCPVLGELPRNICLDWQARPYAATSSHRVEMYNACRVCPFGRSGGKRDG